MTVVLLHPIGLDGDSWQWLRPLDLELGPAVRYTMAWHGSRPMPSEPLTLGMLARDVVESIDGALDVVGSSLGGAVAQHMALAYPNRVRSLMLIASSAGSADGSAMLDRAAQVEANGMEGILGVTLERWFTRTALESGSCSGVAYVKNRLLSDDPRAFAACWRALAGHDTADKMRRLAMPITVVHPDHDASSSLQAKQRLAESFPRSRLVVVEGPHLVQLECPDVVADAIVDHLDWVAASSRGATG